MGKLYHLSSGERTTFWKALWRSVRRLPREEKIPKERESQSSTYDPKVLRDPWKNIR